MGYLDSSTITVDMILTKHGRKLLAQGQGLNISKFALSDDGIDYDLWNVDHPSGSAEYGNAITSLPQTEPTPDDFTLLTYKLNTLNRNVKYLPYIDLQGGESSYEFEKDDQGKTVKIEPITYNMPGGQEQYQLLCTDASSLTIGGGNQIDIGSSPLDLASNLEIPQSQLVVGNNFTISPNPVDRAVTTTLKITGVTSGAHLNIPVKIKANIN